MVTVEDYGRIAKLTAYLVGTIYVTGVVVVNLRLAQFGISGMGLLREQYIFAGAWAILPVLAISVIAGTFCGFAIQMFRLEQLVKTDARGTGTVEPSLVNSKSTVYSWTDQWRKYRRIVRRITPVVTATGRAVWTITFWVVIAAGLFSYAVNRAVPAATTEITTLEVLVTGGKIALFTAGIGLCGAFAVDILRTTNDKWNYILAAAVSLTAAIVLLSYLSFFAVSVYARIPAAIGGGADTNVRLLLSLDPAKAKRLGISDDGVTTFRLLFVTNNMYYIVSPKDATRAVGIPSTAILGIETVH